jgi:hypothetical protein
MRSTSIILENSGIQGHGAHRRWQHLDSLLQVNLVTDVEGFTRGRVIFVGEDHRSASPQRGQVLLTIQPVVKKSALPDDFPCVDVQRLELLLLDKTIEIHEDNVKERLDITMDWEFDPGDP